MNVLITGSDGQLGTKFKEAVETISEHNNLNFKPFYTTSKTLDITDEIGINKFVRENEIDIILNLAAYTNVDMAEEDPDKAILINSNACRYLANAIKTRGGYLIHISTDYVFNGETPIPRKPDDETSPIGVYGYSKLCGEKEIQKSNCHYLIFRTSWLYSNIKRNFVKDMYERIKAGMPLNVVYDQVGSPTNAEEFAVFLYNLINCELFKRNDGIYHFTNLGVTSWYDLTMEIAYSAHEFVNAKFIKPCLSVQYPNTAKRPHYSVLDVSKTIETFGYTPMHWKIALEKTIYQLKNKE